MVYSRIDTFSCVHYDTSVRAVFNIYGIPEKYLTQNMSKMYKGNVAGLPSYILEFNKIKISLRNEDLVRADDDFFSQIYKNIRIEFSGSAMRNYHCMGGTPEIDFFNAAFFGNPGSFSITRCDFAFDFVNMGDDFPYQLIDYLFDYHSAHRKDPKGGTIRVAGTKHPLSYQYFVTTAYLGSRTSGDNQFLRVYDKLEETKDNYELLEAYDAEFAGDEHIDSWFRIELQTRRNYSNKVLGGAQGDIMNVLRYIFDFYKIIDDNGEIPEFILSLFDWESIQSLVLSSDFIQLDKPMDEKVKSACLGPYRNMIAMNDAMYDDVRKVYDDRNYSIFCDAMINTPYHKRRFEKYKAQLDQLCTEMGIPDCENRFEKLPGIIIFQHAGVDIPLSKFGHSPTTLVLRFQHEVTS